MRRVALAGALAAAGAVAVVGAPAWPSRSSVEARPFPPAASQLRQLWATAPRARAPLPANVALGLGAPAHLSDARMAVEARFVTGRPLGLWVWQRANGEVC